MKFQGIFKPVLYFPEHPESARAYHELLEQNKSVLIIDHIGLMIAELIKTRSPGVSFSEAAMQLKTAEFLGGKKPENYGVWVYYPWLNHMVHVLAEEDGLCGFPAIGWFSTAAPISVCSSMARWKGGVPRTTKLPLFRKTFWRVGAWPAARVALPTACETKRSTSSAGAANSPRGGFKWYTTAAALSEAPPAQATGTGPGRP